MSVVIDGTNGVTASASFLGTGPFTGSYSDGIVADYTTGIGRISVGASDAIAFYRGGIASTESMRIDSSGNVGIGTSSPAQKVDVLGSIAVRASTTGTNQDAVVLRAYNSDVTAYSNAVYYGNSQKWCYAGSTVGASLDSSGNLLVGTTSAPSTTVAGRQIAGGASGYFQSSSGSSTTTYYHAYFTNGNGDVGKISTSGTSTTYATSSDYRLKENIQPMQNALDVVQALKPCTYTWKADGSDGQGFIAHELAEVVPDCVTGEKDAVDAEGNPVYQGIDTSFLVATLTAAIQELNAKVEAQAAEIAALKGQA